MKSATKVLSAKLTVSFMRMGIALMIGDILKSERVIAALYDRHGETCILSIKKYIATF